MSQFQLIESVARANLVPVGPSFLVEQHGISTQTKTNTHLSKPKLWSFELAKVLEDVDIFRMDADSFKTVWFLDAFNIF